MKKTKNIVNNLAQRLYFKFSPKEEEFVLKNFEQLESILGELQKFDTSKVKAYESPCSSINFETLKLGRDSSLDAENLINNFPDSKNRFLVVNEKK